MKIMTSHALHGFGCNNGRNSLYFGASLGSPLRNVDSFTLNEKAQCNDTEKEDKVKRG